MTMLSLKSDSRRLDDCWNRVGAWGNRDCPELKKVLHCRNCNVYSAAAARLLEQGLPEGYLDDWTAHFANDAKVADEQSESAAVFRIGPEWLALPLGRVREIVEDRPIHSLPHLRNKILLGLVSIRGELLICVTLAKLLSLQGEELLPASQSLKEPFAPGPAPSASKARNLHGKPMRDFRRAEAPRQNPKLASGRTAYWRFIVAGLEGSTFVFPADEVGGIHRFRTDALTEVPATLAKARTAFTRAIFHWQSKSVGLLDEQSLFGALDRSLM
jgi:chemotaxis-related protein WspD